ncbi:MAG: flagellar motor switch phosphatase FliY [Firmicutes bacterium HGW-Firmicutes-5]|nr:MAG: flagellar motor switch phosphatase FliY [Firmicutes bacterium HGW-Firmicutes-5]
MGEMLSQEEINALLRGLDDDEDTTKTETSSNVLSDVDKDAIGEVSNISMGTAATTLFSLVNQKVVITTPTVSLVHWDDIVKEYSSPCVAIQIVYKEGLEGTNLLILKEEDVKVITDLMMGGDGSSPDGELSDLHLSAISEAMNQMIGSAATSMSSMFNKRIDIAPPISNQLDLTESFDQTEVAEFLGGEFIRVSFRLQIGDLVDSEMMQLYPIEFAQKITDNFSNTKEKEEQKQEQKQEKPVANQNQQNQQTSTPQPQPQMQYQQPDMNQGMNQGMMPPGYNQNGMSPSHQRNVEVQQAQFQSFDMGSFVQQKENIDLIMDVPLEVTVELGRTHKSIHDILEFAPGTIIELNKLAGEPIDVLVNGKIVAKGEVVVIDENFSIRITDIIKQAGQIL